MNILHILHSPTKQLVDELTELDAKILQAAKRGDMDEMKRLGQRKKELPDLIRESHLNDLGDQINKQRSRLGVFEAELKEARETSFKLTSELVPKITKLSREIERLRSEAYEAQAVRESLQFTVGQESRELARLKRMKESFLVNQIAQITQ